MTYDLFCFNRKQKEKGTNSDQMNRHTHTRAHVQSGEIGFIERKIILISG